VYSAKETAAAPKAAAASHGHSHGGGNMNMRGVFLHVMADALGSVVVIVSALIMWKVCESFFSRYIRIWILLSLDVWFRNQELCNVCGRVGTYFNWRSVFAEFIAKWSTDELKNSKIFDLSLFANFLSFRCEFKSYEALEKNTQI